MDNCSRGGEHAYWEKKITISAFIVVVFISVIVWAATSYPNAAISFSGIKMVANGSTTQGFVDISLKNIDSTAISYCIEYDKKLHRAFGCGDEYTD